MLKAFAEGVSPATRERLRDPGNPAPFANLHTGSGSIKAHGITGATSEMYAQSHRAIPPATLSQ